MNVKKDNDLSKSLFSAFIVGILVIFCFYLAFEFSNWIMGAEYYFVTIIMMVTFAILAGADYPLYMKESSKSPIAMIAFFITLYAAGRFLNVFEINLFVIITIIAATLVRILIWLEVIKKEAPAPNNLSEK